MLRLGQPAAQRQGNPHRHNPEQSRQQAGVKGEKSHKDTAQIQAQRILEQHYGNSAGQRLPETIGDGLERTARLQPVVDAQPQGGQHPHRNAEAHQERFSRRQQVEQMFEGQVQTRPVRGFESRQQQQHVGRSEQKPQLAPAPAKHFRDSA